MGDADHDEGNDAWAVPASNEPLDPAHSVDPETGKDVLTCPTCSRRFVGSIAAGGLKSNFARHLRSHATVDDATARPYACPACGKRFTTSTNLKRHVNTCDPAMLEHVVAGFTRSGGGEQAGRRGRDISATRGSVREAVSVIHSRRCDSRDADSDGDESAVGLGAATSIGSWSAGIKRMRNGIDHRMDHPPSLLSLNQLGGVGGGGRGGFEVVSGGAGIKGAFGIVLPTQMSFSPHLFPQHPLPSSNTSTPDHPPTSGMGAPALAPLSLDTAAIPAPTPARFGLTFDVSTKSRDQLLAEDPASASAVALTPEALHSCPFCEKQFVWRNSLTQHITLHHRSVKESFVCGLCQASLSSRTKLRRHQRYHCPFADRVVDGDNGDQDVELGVTVSEVRTAVPAFPPLTIEAWDLAVAEVSGVGVRPAVTSDVARREPSEADLVPQDTDSVGHASSQQDLMGNRSGSDGGISSRYASPASYTVRQFPNPNFGIVLDTNAPRAKTPFPAEGMGLKTVSFTSSHSVVVGDQHSEALSSTARFGGIIPNRDFHCPICQKVFTERRFLKAHHLRRHNGSVAPPPSEGRIADVSQPAEDEQQQLKS